MLRDLGVLEAIHGTLPAALVLAAAAVTQLGDVWLFATVLTALYWYWDRERGLELVAIALGGLALVVVLKVALAEPRPSLGPPLAPEAVTPPLRSLYAATVAADGYSVPSGHAVGATVVWGALALEPGPRRRERLLAAGIVVALVAASRVVLGVHYAGDVLLGVAIGAAYLGAARRLVAALDRPVPALLAFAATLGALAVALPGGSGDGLGTLGAVTGVALGVGLAPPPTDPWPRDRRGIARGVTAGAAVLAGTVSAWWLLDAAGTPTGGGLFVVAATGAGLAVGAPRIAAQNVSR